MPNEQLVCTNTVRENIPYKKLHWDSSNNNKENLAWKITSGKVFFKLGVQSLARRTSSGGQCLLFEEMCLGGKIISWAALELLL